MTDLTTTAVQNTSDELTHRASAVRDFASWRPLFYLTIYRLVLAGILLAGAQAWVESFSFGFSGSGTKGAALGLLSGYVLVCAASFLAVWRLRQSIDVQLTALVVVDTVVFSTLIFLSGGLRSGFGVMLLVTLAGASLVGQGRLTLFYAAVAAIGVLGQEVLQGFLTGLDPSDLFLAGVLSGGFFVTAGTVRALARRLLANEELAKRRGVALRRQMQLSEAVITLMQDGVLVVASSGLVQQANPRAKDLIGGESDSLSDISDDLAESFSRWVRSGEINADCDFRARRSGLLLQARFVRVDGEGDDSLVFIEDQGQVRAEAQKVKLAALGRLTASIAHEIRNPLSAIRHAGELLGESRLDEGEQRLIRIVADNTKRLDGIVSDVLQLGRRDRVRRESIDLGQFVSGFVDQLTRQSGVTRGVLRIAIAPGETMEFDRSHLHQVLWNLVNNAVRHCRQEDGSVRLWTESGRGWCALHVADDGEGISESQRTKIFEPFYTTHAKGTGLGLFIARELSDANGGRLELLDNAPGAHFRIVGDKKE